MARTPLISTVMSLVSVVAACGGGSAEMLESGDDIDDLVIERCLDALGRGMMAVERVEMLADVIEEVAPVSAEAVEAGDLAPMLRAMIVEAEQSFRPPEP